MYFLAHLCIDSHDLRCIVAIQGPIAMLKRLQTEEVALYPKDLQGIARKGFVQRLVVFNANSFYFLFFKILILFLDADNEVCYLLIMHIFIQEREAPGYASGNSERRYSLLILYYCVLA